MGILKAWNKFLDQAQNIQSDFNMMKVIDAEHARVHEGLLFNISKKVTIPASSDYYYVVRTNGLPMHFRPIHVVSNASPMDVRLYEAPFINVNSIGNEVLWLNKNRQSSNVTSSQMFDNPFINTASIGTELSYGLIEGTIGGAIKQSGGDTASVQEWLLPNSSYYALRIGNGDSTNPATISIEMSMYETNAT